jgi:choline kinase
MQAVLLAAGMATRLRPLTDLSPKCLLDVGGKSILQRAVENLVAVGVDEVVIVTGYRPGMIRAHMAERFPSLRVRWINNDRYAETNNAYSLMLAEPEAPGEFLLLDSDILFPAELIRSLLACPDRPCIALHRHECGEEEMKIVCGESGWVTDVAKTIDPRKAAGESIGFELFDRSSRDRLFETLRRRIVDEKRENEYYEASFKEMVDHGFGFRTVDISSWPATEVDTIEDLERARSLFR